MRGLSMLATGSVAAAATLQAAWDEPYGSDGPWQAILIELGSDPLSDLLPVSAPFYPTASWYTALLVSDEIQEWNTDSPTANETYLLWGAFRYVDSLGIMDGRNRPIGDMYVDFARFSPDDTPVVTGLIAAETWDVATRNRSYYTQDVGTLGLGPIAENPGVSDEGAITLPSFIQQLKDGGHVTSNTFGVHIGSVPLGQRGSLILGGYEQNRALGDVAVFDGEDHIDTKVFLVDVILGVEMGGSPFDSADINTSRNVSVWPELSDEAADTTEFWGGAAGSAMVYFNPATPYINLPRGTCSGLAEYLPVTWEDSIGYYVWNTQDPSFERIVSSPAYVGFVFSDREIREVTIKVSMKLLNLTLESPIVAAPLQYFPCQESEESEETDEHRFQLGRAFLQAAFWGFNFEKNLTYLAQAPGPALEQSIVRTHEVDDETIATNPADSFVSTWQSTWTVLEEDEEEEEQHEESASSQEEGGLAGGAIAGIVSGSVAALSLVALAGFCFRRRRRRAANNNEPAALPAAGEKKPDTSEFENAEGPRELHVQERPQELQALEGVRETLGGEWRYELDGEEISRAH